MGEPVFTIGHSTHSSSKLVALLRSHGITAVGDVRSQPFSRMNPQFNLGEIRAALRAAGIGYVFLGKELGARAEDSECYIQGKVQYDRLSRTTLFQSGLDRVVRGSERHRIALLCAEKEPLGCHRTILVSRHLATRGLSIQHILESGALESHDATMNRLLRDLGLPLQDFFRSREDLLREAYERRGEQIAYTVKPHGENASGRGTTHEDVHDWIHQD